MVFLFYFFGYYLSKIFVIRFCMKRFIFTESQWCRLNEGRARKPQINMDVELPKQGRVAAKITPKEFEEKMHAIWDKHIENTYGKFTPSNFVYRFCRQHLDFEEMKAVRDDLAKIQHDEENLDAIGKIESSNGLTYLKCDVGGDWEAPMLFFLYWDGNKFRAYIPTYGNAFNRSTKTAFGNNDEEDLKFLKSQNPDFSDEELSKFIHNVGYNVDACLKDFKARVKVGKGKVSETISSIENKKYILTESQFALLNEMMLLEASLEDIYAKYYSDIPQEEFNKIVFADPTSRPEKNKMGKYGKWLLSLYQRGKLKVGDLNEAKACLEYFVKFINRIEVKDINKYGSIRELYDVVEPFMESPNQATSKSDALRREKEQDATKVYEDDMWEVIVPHTQEMACLYGKHTKWCTAAESSMNMFNYYHRQGELYININKQSGKKYQFHFESDSFMDETDNPINSPIAETIRMTDGLLGYYKNNRSFSDYLRLLYNEVGDESEGFVKVFDENEGYSWVRLSDGQKLATAYYYEDVGDFHNGRAWVYIPHNEREAYGDEIEGDDGDYNFVNERGVLISDVWYQDVDNYNGKYTRVLRDWKPNLIDVNGKPLFGWGQYMIYPTDALGLWSITDPQRGVNFVNGDGQIVSPNMWFDHYPYAFGSDRTSYIWAFKYKYDDNNERYEEQYKVYPNGKIEKRVVEGRSPKRFHMTEEQYHKLILLSKENGKCRHSM